ncbi:hypothetical protein FRC01_005828 [Tulasnella sp. 417]|nr:hypothetical protein FRC01_005828 [Tulasnella sp. 417]
MLAGVFGRRDRFTCLASLRHLTGGTGPAPSEPDPLPEPHTAEEGDAQRSRRPSSRPSFKARRSMAKLGRPFKISLSTLSTVLGRDAGEGSSMGLTTLVEEVPPPVPPLPTSLVVSNDRAPPPAHTGTLIDTRPLTALSDYPADDEEERKREQPHTWLAEVRGWEELVLGDLAEEAEGQGVSSSSAAHAIARMGELKSPGLFSVSTSTTAAETSLSGSTRKNTFNEDHADEEVFGKVPFTRSRPRPRELSFTSAGYAMQMGSRGRTLSSLRRVGPEILEREARVRDSIDSLDLVDSTDSSNGGAMDLEEFSITARMFSADVKWSGDVYSMRNEYLKAEESYIQSRDLYLKIGDQLGFASAVKDLGDVYRLRAEYTKAEELFIQSRDIYSEIGNWLGFAQSVRGLGEVYQMQDEYSKAEESYIQSRDLYSKIGHRRGFAHSVKALGDMYRMRDEHSKAREMYIESRDIYSQIGDQRGFARSLEGIGRLHHALREYVQAAESYLEAQQIYRSIGDSFSTANIFWYLGWLHRTQAQYVDAERLVREASALYGELGLNQDVADCDEFIAELQSLIQPS